MFISATARDYPLLLILSITLGTPMVLRLSVSVTDWLLYAVSLIPVSIADQRIRLKQVGLLCMALRWVSCIRGVAFAGLFLEVGDLLLEEVVGVGRHRFLAIKKNKAL